MQHAENSQVIIVGCIEVEVYRRPGGGLCYLVQVTNSKTKWMVLDFRRTRPPLQPVSTEGVDRKYKYQRQDKGLDWFANTDTPHKRGQRGWRPLAAIYIDCWS